MLGDKTWLLGNCNGNDNNVLLHTYHVCMHPYINILFICICILILIYMMDVGEREVVETNHNLS